MDREKRDEVMSNIIALYRGKGWTYQKHTSYDLDNIEALVECHAKAKAWDVLREYVNEQRRFHTKPRQEYKWWEVIHKMDELVPPSP
jgi:hypothetical protein